MNRNLFTLISAATVLMIALGTVEHAQARGGGYGSWGNSGGTVNYSNVPMGGLVRWDSHVSNQEQSIQSQLSNSTNLTPTQQAALQSRLTNLQSTQTNLNSALTTDLQNKQTYLQNQLNSGTLSSTQQAYVQNRLSQVQTQESALSSGGNPFSNQATWSRGYNGSTNGTAIPTSTTATTVPTSTTVVYTNPYSPYGYGSTNPMMTSTNPYAYGSNYGNTGTTAASPYTSSTVSNGLSSGAGTSTGTSLPQLIGQDQRTYNQAQWIQNQLSSGNLTSQQQSYLQNRLAQLESQQTTLNGNLSSALQNKQTYLQNQLNSGTLSSTQQSNVQNRLSQIQNQQTALSSGSDPFSTPGLWTYQGPSTSSTSVATSTGSY